MENAVEILLVEDDPNDIELTLDALRHHRVSNEIHVVTDGAAALEWIFARADDTERGTRRLPRIVLLDLKLPKVDGIEVLRRVKADERTRRIPIIVLTSSREERDIVETYGLGVNSYIVKPVDFDQFTEAIRMLGMYWLLLNQPPDL